MSDATKLNTVTIAINFVFCAESFGKSVPYVTPTTTANMAQIATEIIYGALNDILYYMSSLSPPSTYFYSRLRRITERCGKALPIYSCAGRS